MNWLLSGAQFSATKLFVNRGKNRGEKNSSDLIPVTLSHLYTSINREQLYVLKLYGVMISTHCFTNLLGKANR